jgi:hypothetical protein
VLVRRAGAGPGDQLDAGFVGARGPVAVAERRGELTDAGDLDPGVGFGVEGEERDGAP